MKDEGQQVSKSQKQVLLTYNNNQEILNAYYVLGMVLSILHKFLLFNACLEQLQEEFHSYYTQILHVQKLRHREVK